MMFDILEDVTFGFLKYIVNRDSISSFADFEIDLVYIENTPLELEKTKDAEDLRIMVYDNVFSEDYQHRFTINGPDVKDLVKMVNEEDGIVGSIVLEDICDLSDPC